MIGSVSGLPPQLVLRHRTAPDSLPISQPEHPLRKLNAAIELDQSRKLLNVLHDYHYASQSSFYFPLWLTTLVCTLRH